MSPLLSPQSDLNELVRLEQHRALATHVPFFAFMSSLAAILLTVSFWGKVDPACALIWCGASIVAAAIQVFEWVRQSSRRKGRISKRSLRIYHSWTWITGIIWASSLIAFYVPGDTVLTLFHTSVLVGVTAVGCTLFAYLPFVSVRLIISIIIPSLIYLVHIGTSLHFSVAGTAGFVLHRA